MVFPGYGSQFVGMCKDLYDSSRLIQECFEEASNCLNSNVIKLCFASSDVELAKMHNAYAALFLVGFSVAAFLKSEGVVPDIVAGCDVGEFAALCTTQTLTLPDGLYVLNKYATTYQELLDELKNVALMRISGVSAGVLECVCKEIRDGGCVVNVALHTADDDHIISGFAESVTRVGQQVACIRGVKCKQSPPELGLHSSLMDPVVGRLLMYLEKVDFKTPVIPFVNSATGNLITESLAAKDYIGEHVRNTLSWPRVLEKLRACDIVIEIGPGNWLHSAAETWYPCKDVVSVSMPADVERVKAVVRAKKDQASERLDEHI